jgi:Na+/citrate or Na+/malate symporter
MSKFANETTWAILFGLQGLAGLYSIIHKSRDKLLLVTDAVLGCMLWTGSCVAMLLSVYPPPAAISAEIVAAIMSWWILVRYPIDWEKKNE